MKTIIIGAGGIASQHCKALRKLGVTIEGIYDIDFQKAVELAKKYDSKAIGNIEEAVNRTDMVHLLTPPSTRTEYVRLAVDAGKPILMEKPISVSLEDARFMEDYANARRVPCMMAFTQRFRKGYQIIKEFLDAGRIGEIVQVFCLRMGPGPGFDGNLQSSWRTDTKYVCGMAIESLSHDIDFLRSLAGKITKVEGQVNGTVKELSMFDNNADAVFGFESGAVGSITASWSSHISYNIKGVIGTKGSVFLQGNDIWNTDQAIIKLNEEYQEIRKIHDVFQEGEGYVEENRCFLQCIREEKPVPCTFTDGRKVLEISKKILETSSR